MVSPCYRLLMTQQQPMVPCTECGTVFEMIEKSTRDSYRRRGRAYCSQTCARAHSARVSAQNMAETNRKHAPARMRARNPMRRADVRDRMAATLREIGHRPRVRGGNGKPVPVPQATLAAFLGWPTDVVVAPGDGDRPYHYKLDIAHPTMMVCVEIDGGSHYSLARRESDRRRDARLASLGWLTFRFSNREATERTAECARMVLSTTSKWQARTPTA